MTIATPPKLPENVVRFTTSRRAWNEVCVDINEWHGAGAVAHRFPFESETRLVALLHEVGSRCEPRLRKDLPCPVAYTPRHMDFVPAKLEMWGYSADARYVKDAALTFDVVALSERLNTTLDSGASSTPRLRFADDRIYQLIQLLAGIVDDPDPSTQLYGDGLIAAIAARLFAARSDHPGAAKGLASWQLRRVIDYLDTHLPHRIRLAEIAELTGLSQSHFSRAFRASTGMAPYHWQLDARVRRAQALLLNSHHSLAQISEATGFADAVHFGRTFKRIVGSSPAAWRRDRKS